MDFTIKGMNKNGKSGNNKMVTLPKATVEKVIDLLSNVECTCVWSSYDNQYLKVNDIPKDIVTELQTMIKLSSK